MAVLLALAIISVLSMMFLVSANEPGVLAAGSRPGALRRSVIATSPDR
ncbi:MAG: hypothetical protein M5U32_09120 [Myxococcota bacterium]|nr:hypothetical protein [Myxococcota bacterium]